MKRIYNVLFAFNSILQKAEKFLGCIALAFLFLVMVVNAALRYFFNNGLDWSDELNGFLFVWFGFLAAAYAMSNQSHLKITALTDLFPKVVQFGMRVVMNIIMIFIFIIYMPALDSLLRTLPISNVMRFPLKYVYIILPISFILMCYHIAFNMIQDTRQFLSERKKKESNS
ncbi:MAG: TRAP transporter small permease subunit [Clostridium sp.]|jgi:TRAP-type C4-dicarboxylate transport system permease small subunit